MRIVIKNIEGNHLAFIESDKLVIKDVEDAVDVLGNCDYQGASSIVLMSNQISADFFDLKTGIAGEVLQKFSNYRKRLAIVGDFSQYNSKALKDFIRESNRSGHINFLPTVEAAIEKLT